MLAGPRPGSLAWSQTRGGAGGGCDTRWWWAYRCRYSSRRMKGPAGSPWWSPGAGKGTRGCSCISRFSNLAIPVVFISANDPCRHVGFNLEDSQGDRNQRRIVKNCKVVANGVCSRSVHLSVEGVGGSAIASASASLAGGGKGVPAESTRVGKGRSIEAAKRGDGADSSVETGGTV